MFDESRAKVLEHRQKEIEQAYQDGKEYGIKHSVAALNKVVEQAKEEAYSHGFERGFTDGQDWANVENSVTFLLALHNGFGFGPKSLMKVVAKSNEYIHAANDGKPAINILARELYEQCDIKLSEQEVEILRKYSIFGDEDPYD